MYPILIQVGDHPLPSYVACMLLAGLAALAGLRKLAPALGLKADDYWFFAAVVGCAGFLGGRFFFLLLHPAEESAGLTENLFSPRQGLATYGALFGLLAGAGLAAWRLRLSFARTLDYLSVIAPVAHALARLGCFLTGCCYGRPAGDRLPWKVVFTDPASAVPADLRGHALHPTQLYEAGGDLVLAAVLYFLLLPRVEGGALPRGLVAAAYLGGYGLLRFAVDVFRGDPEPRFGPGLTLAQILSAGAVLAAVVFVLGTSFARRRRRLLA